MEFISHRLWDRWVWKQADGRFSICWGGHHILKEQCLLLDLYSSDDLCWALFDQYGFQLSNHAPSLYETVFFYKIFYFSLLYIYSCFYMYTYFYFSLILHVKHWKCFKLIQQPYFTMNFTIIRNRHQKNHYHVLYSRQRVGTQLSSFFPRNIGWTWLTLRIQVQWD